MWALLLCILPRLLYAFRRVFLPPTEVQFSVVEEIAEGFIILFFLVRVDKGGQSGFLPDADF